MEKSNKKPEKKSDDKRYRRGINIGSAGMASGALMSALGYGLGGDNAVSEKAAKDANALKIIGPAVLLASGALTGYSAYKHHKYKKNKEEKKDDNSKK